MNGRKLNFDEVKEKRIQTYFIVPLDLSAARVNMEFNTPGKVLYVLNVIPSFTSAGIAGFSVKFNETVNDSIDLSVPYRKIITPFHRFFITNSATIGWIATLLIAPDDLNFSIEDIAVPPFLRPANWCAFQNITCVSAGTGYAFMFGNNVKKIWLHARSADMKIGFAGQSGTTYITLVSGATFTFDNILITSLAGNSLEVQTATAGAILEVMTWA